MGRPDLILGRILDALMFGTVFFVVLVSLVMPWVVYLR